MRNLLALLTLLHITLNFAQKKSKFNYKITYNYTFQIDSIDVNNTESETMLLLLSPQKSYFYSESIAVKDSIFQGKTLENMGGSIGFNKLRQQIPRNRVKFQILKTKDSLSLNYYQKIKLTTYTYHEKYSLEWKLIDEQKDIAGYTCNKATLNYAGRDYIAWYTYSIAITDGPYKFQGLPGLILEIADTKNQHHFLVTKIENKTGAFPKLPNRNIIKETPDKLFKIKKDTSADFIKNVRSYVPNISPEKIREIKARHRRKNNPIELTFDYYFKQLDKK